MSETDAGTFSREDRLKNSQLCPDCDDFLDFEGYVERDVIRYVCETGSCEVDELLVRFDEGNDRGD